jgi:hypothetical protein
MGTRVYLVDADDYRGIQPAELYAEACFRCGCSVGTEFVAPPGASALAAHVASRANSEVWTPTHRAQNAVNAGLAWLEALAAVGCVCASAALFASRGLLDAAAVGCAGGLLAAVVASVTLNHFAAAAVWAWRLRRVRRLLARIEKEDPLVAGKARLRLVCTREMGRVRAQQRRSRRSRPRRSHREDGQGGGGGGGGRATAEVQPEGGVSSGGRKRRGRGREAVDVAADVVYVEIEEVRGRRSEEAAEDRTESSPAGQDFEGIPVAAVATTPAQIATGIEALGFPRLKVEAAIGLGVVPPDGVR